MYNPPLEQSKSIIKLSMDVIPLMWKVIGKEGRVFKAITRKSEVKYIWYDKNTNNIEIWGNKMNLMKAEVLLSDRINSVTKEGKNVTNECNSKKRKTTCEG